MRKFKTQISSLAMAAALLAASGAGAAETLPNGPSDPFLAQAVRSSASREPAIERPAQAAEAQRRLEALRARVGRKPNIVVILMDDVGWGDFGAYGGGAAVGARTPNIDRLAQNGLRLTSAYSQPSCTPTRASLLTGRLPVRSGLLRPFLPGENASGEGLGGEITLAALLGRAGYATHAVGKWHLGAAPSTQPQAVGFDDYYGTLTSSDDYTGWREPWRNPDLANDPARRAWASEGETMAIVEGRAGEAAKPAFLIDLDSIRLVDQKLTERAVSIIDAAPATKKPFFLYLATRGAHNDNYPHPDFAGRSPAKYPYKDVIEELDHRVGQVMEALRKSGQLKNTLVIVTSDNGPFAETFPDTGYTPFRAAKGSIYEGGVRTPLIAYWDGMIAAGRVSDGLFDLMDLFATSLSIAGAADLVPGDRYIDSIDQASFLLADAGESRRRVEYYWLGQVFMGVRVGEFKFLNRSQDVVHDDTSPSLSPFQGAITPSGSGMRLFDLYIDPKEQYGLLPLKQPQIPVLAKAVAAHLATFKAYPPKVPVQ
ncbi:sulfatase-like hydrolase/transferase [Caulobacter sp. CCNWLY153]|uniref:sulfatase-like hydrolase/transferase n=1 Tax=unclassified Caulobacter TaxID=2648921 RepID=UPI002FF11D11